MTKYTARALIVCVGLLCLSCSSQKDEERAKAISDLINQNLQQGDPRKKIEIFLNDQKWIYSYDDMLEMYTARDPANKSNFVGFRIKIYVDNNENFKSSHVEIWYNTL